jgi:probable rRNA maturation factor
MITFQIKEAYRAEIDTVRLEIAARDTLVHQKYNPNAELSIVIEDEEHIQALNKKYRGMDEPTDVLSFSYGGVDPDSGQDILGDILIAYPIAARQAEEGKHPVMDELILLVVHATLHLLGYDHETEEGKEDMWQVQNDILETLEVNAKPHD